MHEVIIQVCFVIAGFVNACTTGVVYTDHPSLVESVAPVVYVESAPRRVISYYSLFSVPVPVVDYRRTYRTRGIYTHAVRHRGYIRRHHHRPKVTVKPAVKYKKHKKHKKYKKHKKHKKHKKRSHKRRPHKKRHR